MRKPGGTRKGLIQLRQGELAGALDNTLPDPDIALGDSTAMRVHVEDDAYGQAVLVRGERADLARELRRKHRAEPVDELNGSAPLLGLTVEKRVGLDKVRDIGNVDANFDLAVGQ